MRHSTTKLRTQDRGPADSQVPDATAERKARRREATPAQRALGLLVRREHSRQELTRKLVARGIAEEEAVVAVERMSEAGWQDDNRFACSLARTRAAAGYGPLWIRSELTAHGLAGAAVEQAFASLAESGDDDWTARARDLVRRRHGPPGQLSLALQRKASDLLLRRGFSGGTVRAAIRSLPGD